MIIWSAERWLVIIWSAERWLVIIWSAGEVVGDYLAS